MAIGETVAPRPPWTKCRTRSVAAGPRSTGPALWHQRSNRPTCIGRLLQTSDARRRPKAMVDRLTLRGQHRLQNLRASGGARSATPTHFPMRQRPRPAVLAPAGAQTRSAGVRIARPHAVPAAVPRRQRHRARARWVRKPANWAEGFSRVRSWLDGNQTAIPPTPRNLPRAVPSAPTKGCRGRVPTSGSTS